jgi:exoribonuclease II
MTTTISQQWVLDYLKDKDFTSPSVIGIAHAREFGLGMDHHSAWASPICKRLVERGLLERNNKGHYRLR